MALTLTVEDGTSKTDSNTYISLADANAYFEGRLNASDWTGATDANKNAGLVQAARILDRYIQWLGLKTDEDQAMKWPRWGICYDSDVYYECENWWLTTDGVYSVESNIVLQEIKDAQCELALVLLGQDTQKVPDMAGFKRIDVAGAVEVEADKRDRAKEIPSHVWKIVSYLGKRRGGAVMQLMRG